MGIMGRDLYKKDEGIAPVDGLENESVSQGQGKCTCSSIPFCLREDSLCPHRASMKAFSGASWAWDHIFSSPTDSSGWWKGRLHGQEGLFPGNYVEKI